MITNETKQQIISNLQQVPVETVWGIGINLFVEQVAIKTDEDYKRIVADLQSQLSDGPEGMKNVLGPSYDFFKDLQLNEA